MITSTVSSKYQIVIPQQMRESLKINAGQKIQLIQILDRIEIVSIKPISEMRGFLKGMNSDFIRDESDRFIFC
jgi:AbrB family looped-hinge helix DNA binding protein